MLPRTESCSASVRQRVSPSSQQFLVISLYLMLVAGRVISLSSASTLPVSVLLYFAALNQSLFILLLI